MPEQPDLSLLERFFIELAREGADIGDLIGKGVSYPFVEGRKALGAGWRAFEAGAGGGVPLPESSGPVVATMPPRGKADAQPVSFRPSPGFSGFGGSGKGMGAQSQVRPSLSITDMGGTQLGRGMQLPSIREAMGEMGPTPTSQVEGPRGTSGLDRGPERGTYTPNAEGTVSQWKLEDLDPVKQQEIRFQNAQRAAAVARAEQEQKFAELTPQQIADLEASKRPPQAQEAILDRALAFVNQPTPDFKAIAATEGGEPAQIMAKAELMRREWEAKRKLAFDLLMGALTRSEPIMGSFGGPTPTR